MKRIALLGFAKPPAQNDILADNVLMAGGI